MNLKNAISSSETGYFVSIALPPANNSCQQLNWSNERQTNIRRLTDASTTSVEVFEEVVSSFLLVYI